MRHFKGICLVFLLLFCAIQGTAQEVANNYFIHTITRGQSLYSIASMYNTTVADIVKLNPGSDKQINAGGTLRIPQQSQAKQSETPGKYHTIKGGETLYKLTQLYNISAAAICDANPGLSAANFRTGQVIIIPATDPYASQVVKQTPPSIQEEKPLSPCREMHKVKRKETLYSISREYGISKEELIEANPELKTKKLKRGSYICIPYPKPKQQPAVSSKPSKPTSNEELFAKNKKSTQSLNTLQVALMLPFQLDGTGKPGEQALMVEYYEGFLMAIDSLKKQNVSVNLHVYDTGSRSQSIAPILEKPELKNMNIIFGPGYTEHIPQLADFAKMNKIRLVIPFTSKDNEVFTNPYVYQINTPQSYLFSQVYQHFTEMFSDCNLIFIQSSPEEKDKEDFINGLKQELANKHLSYKTVALSEDPETSLNEVLAISDSLRRNVFIPTSGSNVTLIRVLPILKLVKRNEVHPRTVSLFGYPEWQKYTKDHLDAFFELDTYFYSSFYTNNLLPNSVKFNREFREWYNKEMINSYPKYGMLGFDTGYYFLKGLSLYGTNLENNLPQLQLNPVQTGFRFDRVNNWGGFINKKVFFVHMNNNYELIKLDFQ